MWIAWASQALTLLRDGKLRRAVAARPRRDAVPRRDVLFGAFGAAALAATVLLLASLPPGL